MKAEGNHKKVFNVMLDDKESYFYNSTHFKNFLIKNSMGFKESDEPFKLNFNEKNFEKAIKNKNITIKGSKERVIWKRFSNKDLELIKYFVELGVPYQRGDKNKYAFEDDLLNLMWQKTFNEAPPFKVFTNIKWGTEGLIIYNSTTMKKWSEANLEKCLHKRANEIFKICEEKESNEQFTYIRLNRHWNGVFVKTRKKSISIDIM